MMQRLNNILYAIIIISIALVCKSCYKDGTLEPNPFEENMVGQDSVNLELIEIDPTSIAGLYQNIFGPTCANSGCHDGTFEPDFRTMESKMLESVYFAGEVLNIDAVTGGFNFQAAWTTAWLLAQAIAKK